MSRGNKSAIKKPSNFKDAVTGKSYKRMTTAENAKALNAAKAFASTNPQKQFYA